VGYRLAVSAETLRGVPAAGKQVQLNAHLVMRDDAIQLYGFSSEAERDLFLMLIGVQGVGPKVALAVLSGGSPRDLTAAMASGDSARFQAVPGIGKRTAERIIVELREKVADAASGDDIVVRRASDNGHSARWRRGQRWSRRRPCSTPSGGRIRTLLRAATRADRTTTSLTMSLPRWLPRLRESCRFARCRRRTTRPHSAKCCPPSLRPRPSPRRRS